MRDIKPPQRRQRRLAPAVEDAIELAAARGDLTAARIHAELGRDPALAGLPIPDVRTIQRRLKERAARDVEAWTVAAGTPEEAAAVFAVLATVIEETRGRRRSVTTAEARFLAKLAAVAGGLDPWLRLLLARAYAGREQAALPAYDLDAFVSFAPWASEARRRAYWKAVGTGAIPPAPGYLTGLRLEAGGGGDEWDEALKQRERITAPIRPYVEDALRAIEEHQTTETED